MNKGTGGVALHGAGAAGRVPLGSVGEWAGSDDGGPGLPCFCGKSVRATSGSDDSGLRASVPIIVCWISCRGKTTEARIWNKIFFKPGHLIYELGPVDCSLNFAFLLSNSLISRNGWKF